MSQLELYCKKLYNYLPKNKYLRLSLLLFVFWLLVTSFFYFQHYRVEKVMPLNEEVKIDNLLIKIKELNLINYKNNYSFTEMPWYYYFPNKLPQPLRWPFIKFFSYYSFSPLEFNNEVGTIYLRGYIVSPTEKLTYEKLQEQFDIYIAGPYEVGYRGRSSLSRETNENIIYFEEEGGNVPLETKELYIIIRDKLNKTERKISITPEWDNKAYTIFNHKPNYPSEPKDSMKSFANFIKQAKRSKAAEYIHLDRAKNFPWVNLQHSHWEKPIRSYINFIGSYQGYENVFAYHMVFGETKYDEFIGLFEQDLYLIDNGQKWIIIDASPLTNYKLNISLNDISEEKLMELNPSEVMTLYFEALKQRNAEALRVLWAKDTGLVSVDEAVEETKKEWKQTQLQLLDYSVGEFKVNGDVANVIVSLRERNINGDIIENKNIPLHMSRQNHIWKVDLLAAQ